MLRGGFKREDLGGRGQKEHHGTRGDPLIRREIKCHQNPILQPWAWCILAAPWSAACLLGTCSGFILMHSQPRDLGSCWEGGGMAISPRSSLTLCFSIWLSLIHGSQTLLLMSLRWCPSCSKTWWCEDVCFSLAAPLLFCFVVDVYGAEQREDHFPVQCHSGPVVIQSFQPGQKNSHQSVCPLISFARLILPHVRIRPFPLCLVPASVVSNRAFLQSSPFFNRYIEKTVALMYPTPESSPKAEEVFV